MNNQRHFVLLFVCLQSTIFFAFSCSAMSDEDKRQLLELGKISDLKKRLKRLDSYLLSHPQSARLIGYRAELDNALLLHDDTIRDASKYFLLNKEPVVAQICKVRAQAYTHKEELKKALTDLLLAKKLAPNDGETRLMLGIVLEKMDQDQEALAELNDAIKFKCDSARSNRARVLFKLGRASEGTLECIALMRNGNDLWLQDSILHYLYETKKQKEIVDFSDALIKAKLASHLVYSTKASVLFQLGRYEQALVACDQSLAAGYDPLDKQRYEIYKALKQTDNAVKQLNKMLKAQPKDLSLFLRRADLYMENRHYDLALADFLRADDLVATDKKAQAKRAECYFRIGNYAQAARQYAVLNQTIDNIESLTYEALSLKALNKYDQAAQVFSKALKLKPLSSTLFSYRADCYGRKHDYKKADSDLTDAITLSPKMYSLYCARGAFRYEAGDYKAAVADYTAALVDPRTHGLAYKGRAMAYRKLGLLDKAAEDERASASANKALEVDLFKQ